MIECKHSKCIREFVTEHGMKVHYGIVHGRPDKVCPMCSTVFSAPPSEFRRRVYCSRQCHNVALLNNHPNAVEWIDLHCEWCGCRFRRPPSIAKAQRFCSRACNGKWQSHHWREEKHPRWSGGLVPLRCKYCAAPYAVKRKDVGSSRFCSRKCSYAWQSENLAGPQSHHWRGGCVAYYGPDWQKQKRKARKRDDYACQLCGVQESELSTRLDVHHIISFREFGYIVGENNNHQEANRLDNLMCLCAPCHRKMERDSVYD